MKKRFIAAILAALAGLCPLAALQGGFLGAGAEANANTREGAAFGGGLAMGLDITSAAAAGLSTAFSRGGGVSALEPAAFFRLSFPLANTAFFVQASLGASVLFEDGEAFPAFMGGLAVGWRFNIGRSFYIEPAFRGGYPFAWGCGVAAGIRFQTLGNSLNR